MVSCDFWRVDLGAESRAFSSKLPTRSLFSASSTVGLGLRKVHRKKKKKKNIRGKKETWEGDGEKKRMLKEERKIHAVLGIFIYLWFNFKSLPDFIGTN